MFPEDVGHEDRELLTRAAEAAAAMRVALPDAAEAYLRLVPGGAEPPAREWELLRELAEEVAELWRDAERANATEPEVEQAVGAEGVNDLLGSLADSSVLALLPSTARGARPLGHDAVVQRLDELRESGAWDAAAPREALTLEPTLASDPELDDRFEGHVDRLLAALGEGSVHYRQLNPDGRPLSEAESEAGWALLCELAAAQRALDGDRRLLHAFADRRDLRPALLVLRSIQNSLLLALSESAARRAKAISLDELAARARPVYEAWKSAAT